MIDQFGRSIEYLRLSITDRCNLRCKYCMPAEGVEKIAHEEILTLEEIVTVAKAFVSMGIKKVRITGGEPTTRLGLLWLIEQLKAIHVEEIAMTTNAILLPEMAKPLKEAGLDRVNVSLDTLNPKKYKEITRLGALDQALAGIEAALSAGLTPVKVNAVLMKGFNDDEIADLCDLTLKKDIHVRFIELMPIGFARGHSDEYLPVGEVLERVPTLIPIQRESSGSVARRYRLPGAVGTVGLISPISDHFCAECNRIRLTSDGKLKLCLHSEMQYDIKPVLREGGDLMAAIVDALQRKPESHRLNEGIQVQTGMSAIGG